MQQHAEKLAIPDKLPFLEAVCWDLHDVYQLTPDNMLNRYERGWDFKGVLADVDGDEKDFIRELARQKGSWLVNHVHD